MRILATAAAALALLAPAPSSAQPVSTNGGAGPDTYLELHLGAFFPQHDDLDAFDTGFAFGGTFGARFTPNLGVEGEIGYVRATGDGGLPGATLEETLAIVPLSASLRFRLPLKVAELSALAGVGLHIASLDAESTVTTAPGFSDTSTAFGFHVGAAVGFNLSPTMLFGVEARRTFVKAKFDGVDTNLDGLRLALTLGYHF